MAKSMVQAGVCNVPNRTVFEGEDLDVMQGMNDGCVDLIYLDRAFGSDWDCAVVIGSGVAGLHALPEHLTVDRVVAGRRVGLMMLRICSCFVGIAIRWRRIGLWGICGRGWLGLCEGGIGGGCCRQ